jgi:hypothetical protein
MYVWHAVVFCASGAGDHAVRSGLLLAGIGMQFFFSLANSWKMYTSRNTLFNPRVLLVPFVDAMLVYYETFWFIEGLLTPSADAQEFR